MRVKVYLMSGQGTMIGTVLTIGRIEMHVLVGGRSGA
jgi:hypothetical protein